MHNFIMAKPILIIIVVKNTSESSNNQTSNNYSQVLKNVQVWFGGPSRLHTNQCDMSQMLVKKDDSGYEGTSEGDDQSLMDDLDSLDDPLLASSMSDNTARQTDVEQHYRYGGKIRINHLIS